MAADSQPSAATYKIACTSLTSLDASKFYSEYIILGVVFGKTIGIVVLPPLTVLGSEIVLVDALDSAYRLPLEILQSRCVLGQSGRCTYEILLSRIIYENLPVQS
jgi:hypothetical protein